MRVLIASDAAAPQVNGVVRTLGEVSRALRREGVAIRILGPDNFACVPLPLYPEIKLAVPTREPLARIIDDFAPDAIHVATEGPIGLATRAFCLRRGLPFTTSYHTRFPEYLAARAPVPMSWSYAWLRRFHAAAVRTMVATATIERELTARGFKRLARWSRGVDQELFHPEKGRVLPFLRPIFLSVGRVAVEKNLEAFLALDLPGTKLVVGDGPDRAALAAAYPGAVFLGVRTGEDLAALYASADVFVFPSRTDTFGNVMVEALASGTPVAAFPVPGPIDVIEDPLAGVLDEDLRAACLLALTLDRCAARRHALTFDWMASARQFRDNLAPIKARGEATSAQAAARATSMSLPKRTSV